MRYRAFAPVLLAATTLAAGCGWSHDRDDGYFAYTTKDTTPIVLGAGDVQISNRDSSMDLALAGDKVVMQFGQRVQTKLKHDLDTTNARSKSDFGAMVERTVKREVGSMLNRRIEVPLSDVKSVTLKNEEIAIEMQGRRRFSFDNIKADHNRPILSTFAPDDAQRFVTAVQQRMTERATKP